MSHLRLMAAPLASLLLAGCAGLPTDLGRADVAQQARGRGLALATDASTRELTQQWLAAPLTLDRAIQIALINNPELRARYAHLGLAAADVYDAGRLSNPLLSATQLSAGGEAHTQLTLGIAINFTDLLFMHARSKAAGAQFEAEKSAVAAAVLDLAAEVETAYRRCTASAQIAALRTTLAQTAQASADLAQRYFDAGNLKRGSLALEQASSAQAALQAESSALDRELARGDLQRLLGLSAAQTQWQLAEPLAALPAQDASLDQLLQLAADSRLDVVAARRHIDAVTARYGLARQERVLGKIEVGAERERDYDGSLHAGPKASVELPLFNWGSGRMARAQAELDIAESELSARELDLRRDVGAAYASLSSSRARAERFRDELIPARETVFAQMQLEHNYMLIGVFELLSARQQSFEAYTGYLEALRDYWVAHAQLARAVGRRLPDAAAAPTTEPASEAPPPAPETAPTHSHDHGATQP